ncbi:MAG: efflux RND transporter periplasmic adaptor subunit [Burkholderiaceae bacterium]|jgi:RND family efflux transporter MFP subunit|nr:efflux RND transporter periplasmic adaptor subunit [Burkholderiaceae bacterium]MEB2319803.1 efflux RND transporter periplasmic adaptor subunit [Pseudomonadota bacterium]
MSMGIPRARDRGDGPIPRVSRPVSGWLAGLMVAFVLAGCDGRAEAPSSPEILRPVRTLVVGEQVLSQSLRLPAEVRPRIETRYGFRVGGKIAERKVSIGDRVSAGQSLARLDPQDVRPAIDSAQAVLEAARTELSLAESELERIRELRAQGYVSQGQLDRQQAAADAARARAAQASAGLASARNSSRFQDLRADDPGVVTGVDADAGQVVAAGQVVIRVAPLGEFELLVDVPEADLGAIAGIARWRASLPALAGRSFEARLRELSPVADPATRSYPMRLSLLGDTSGIALGMSATVEAVRDSRRGIVLPLSALVAHDGDPGVWVVGPDATVSRVEIEIGEMRDDGVLVAGGLRSGDRVVIAGANLLHAGQKVRLDEASR